MGIHCITGHPGGYLFQAFKHKATGRTIGSLNIHARHPSGKEAIEYHAKKIRGLIEGYLKKVHIFISGGDLNEAHVVLGYDSWGHGAVKKMGSPQGWRRLDSRAGS